MASTAAMCMAVGKVSLEDWLMLMSSLGCRSFSPAISLPRLAMTSLAFMLDWVPLPVCQTTRGKWSLSAPAITSSQAWEMAASLSSMLLGLEGVVGDGGGLFEDAEGVVISRGMVSMPTPILKFSWLRSVWGPILVGGHADLAHRIVFNAVIRHFSSLSLSQLRHSRRLCGRRNAL